MKTARLLPLGRRIKTALGVASLFLFFLAIKPSYGQSGQLGLSLRLMPELQNAQILRVSDFNITGSGSVSKLFDLTITNTGAPTVVTLRFQLTSDRFGGAVIVDALSQQFNIPANGTRTLTYQDLTLGGRIEYDAESLKELTDTILKIGRLPTGIYTFTVIAEGPSVRASDDQQIVVSNPTTLDLISPGAPVGGSECFAQFGLLPQFKWDSNADRFLITVCEAMPSNSSPEDVMQNVPRLQQQVQRGVDFFGSPSFMYPSGGLPLEYGKTYYWQILAMIDAPSGEVRLPSEIWCFQISALGNPGGEIMLQQLLSLLSSGDFDALFRAGGPLHGFKPTGAASLNGRRLSLNELMTFMRSRSLRIVSTQVEP